MSDQDAAARQAAELLPCKCDAGFTWDGLEQHAKSCAYWCRPAVAAALRGRDEALREMRESWNREGEELWSHEEQKLRERIAALELRVKEVEAENAGYEFTRDERIAMYDKRMQDFCDVLGLPKQASADDIESELIGLREIRKTDRERIAALTTELSETQAERNARARDVMHLEAELESARAQALADRVFQNENARLKAENERLRAVLAEDQASAGRCNDKLLGEISELRKWLREGVEEVRKGDLGAESFVDAVEKRAALAGD